MGTLTCVRHGQASFGAANYDQLSPLGIRQSERLGAFFGERMAQGVLKFDRVITGSLVRHAQTYAGIQQGVAEALQQAGQSKNAKNHPLAEDIVTSNAIIFEVTAEPTHALNEYDSEALIHAQLRADPPAFPLPPPQTPEGYKAHFRVLRAALKAWIAGGLNPSGMPTFEQFRQGIAELAVQIASEPETDWLVVSSGGPLSTLVMHVLKADPLSMIELNYQMKNTAVTRFHLSPGKLHLSGFNALPHLDHPGLETWVTSA